MTKKINYNLDGKLIKFYADDYGWADRLCESVLDSAKWAKCIDARTYQIDDKEELDCLIDYLAKFNASDFDDETLSDAITDWCILQ